MKADIPLEADPGLLMEEFCLEFRVPIEKLQNRCRKAARVDLRSWAAHLLYKSSHFSSSEVGDVLHRDHTTVLYLVKRAESLMGKATRSRLQLCILRAEMKIRLRLSRLEKNQESSSHVN